MSAYDAFMHQLALSHAPEFAETGLTMAQAKVLYLVQGSAPVRMSELAVRLGVTVSTTSAQVDRLVERGLLTRRDDPIDRRHVVLALTDAGAADLERMRELNTGHMRRLLAGLSDDELAVIEHSIEILAAAASRLAATSRDTGAAARAPAAAAAPTTADTTFDTEQGTTA